MSEHTPITGELREAVEWEPTFCGHDRAMVPQPEFDRICGAIDAVHAGLERENAELRERLAVLDNERGNMHETDAWRLGYDEGFASADDWMADNEDAMEEHGWIRLPLDADGVPIHVGDVVEYADNPTELFTASYIELEKNGWWVFGGVMGRRPDKYRHHHEPTVEDVLTEFFSRYVTTKPKDEDDAFVAEYAAKLRLAGDGE